MNDSERLELKIADLDEAAEVLLDELKANYGARVGQTIAGRLQRGAGGRFASSGAAPSRGSAALVREARAQARQTLRAVPKRGKGGKGKKPKQTPEQRAAAREQEKAKNRDAVFGKLGLDGDIQAGLLKLANGDQPDHDVGGLVDSGLATRAKDGTFRLTPQGRALLTAAGRGDAGRARDALSLGQDRAAAAREKAAKEQAGGGGGGSGKPSKEEQRAQNRKKVADAMAAQDAGLSPSGIAAFTAFADGGEGDGAILAQIADEIGLLVADSQGGYRLSKEGRAFARALDKGDTRAALDAISASLDRLRAEQEQDMSGEDVSGGRIVETATKAERYGGTPRGELDDSDFVIPDERTFPVMTGQDVRDAVSSWGRYKGPLSFEQFKRRLTALARRKGFESALPDSWEAKSYIREGDDVHPGAMIAFLLDEATRATLADAAELDADDEDTVCDHVTLIYLSPDAPALDAQKNLLVAQLAALVSRTPPITGQTNGYGRFVGDDEEGDALYVNVDCPELPTFREQLASAARVAGIAYAQEHGFTPHITLTYLDLDDATPDLDIPKLPLTFDRIALVWAGETLTFPLLGERASEVTVPAVDDTMIYAGGEVKSLGDGHIGGYLVVFGDATKTDLAGDFFTQDTDFRMVDGQKTDIYLNHRLPLKTRDGGEIVVRERIGEGTLRRDSHGILIDALLYNRERYEQALRMMGWSSGTAAHLVDRQPIGKAAWLKTWPLGLDASLTPGPCEPRAAAIPLKSYIPNVLEIDPEAGGTPAAVGSARTGAPHIKSATKEIAMDKEELKAMLDEMLKAHAGGIEAKMTELSTAVDTRLKAFEESPALKSSGFISMDGGENDKEVKSFADWLLAVKRRDTKRLITVYKSAWTVFDDNGLAVKDMSEGSGPAGGFRVPVEYEPLLQKISAEAEIVEPRARKITMGSATKLVPMLKQTANPSTAEGGSAFFGGLVFYWNPEGADISADKSDPLWEMVELIARKLTGLTVSSNELTEDAPSIESELTQLFGEGLAHAKDFFYLRGNGVGKPLGVLNAPCAYSLTRKASGNNVEIEDVSGMMARMLPGSFKNAIWVSHPLNISDLIQMKIGDTPVFQPDARGPVAGTLLGRPLAFSEYNPAPGSKGDLMLCDFMAYACGIRRGITIASSEHARFDNDQTTWRITYRGDGQPLLDSTVKLADGSNTEVSPFVLLN